MRRILFLAIPLFALGGCTAELVDPDYQEDDYELDVNDDPEQGHQEQSVTLETLRDPVLSSRDGEPKGPSPYPWVARDPAGSPTPYPWETEKDNNGKGDSETGEGQNQGGDSNNPSGANSQEQQSSNH